MKTKKWKMALLVWSAMFPFSTIVSYALSLLPFTAHWPLVARTFCLTCLLVPYMVCVALPFLTRRFQKWLESNAHQAESQATQREPSVPDSSASIQPGASQFSSEHYALQ